MEYARNAKCQTLSLPLNAIIPAEDWILKLQFENAKILGYVTVIVESCTLR